MPTFYPKSGQDRIDNAKARRDRAAELSFEHAADRTHQTADNGDNARYYTLPMAFSKGLVHRENGLVSQNDFDQLQIALTQPGTDLEVDPVFNVPTAEKEGTPVRTTGPDGVVGYRKMESPLAGLYYENQGPDPDFVGMAPAPKLGESELCAEMAEVYAMAVVRDLSFVDLQDGDTKLTHVNPADGAPIKFQKDGVDATVQDLVDALNDLSWFGRGGPVSSLGSGTLSSDLTMHESRRRAARFPGATGGSDKLTPQNLFRGSSPGCETGPYISEFLWARATKDPGYVDFGAQQVDMRVKKAKPGVDHMTNWAAWQVVQNGENLGGLDEFEEDKGQVKRRLITTPRDLATYVHIDQLYQAYFCGCLMMLNSGVAPAKGFPHEPDATRTGFATFGGPHVLSLLTEVATRGLRAVRRQKFQIHRRARPERLAAMLTLALHNPGALGNAKPKFDTMLKELGLGPDTRKMKQVLDWVAERNALLNADIASRKYTVAADTSDVDLVVESAKNLLLPMAFPEGSPMHPAYGAGHATVAGACTTILKAFFDIYDDKAGSLTPKKDASVFTDHDLTIEGELNKLSANIAIGRNFAGVHFYSDYYDSLRMGERVAVGILIEQMTAYPEPVTMSFRDFDGVRIDIKTNGKSDTDSVTLSVNRSNSSAVTSAWWTKNLSDFPERSGAVPHSFQVATK